MDDLISRQAAIDYLKHRLYETAMNNVGTVCDVSYVYQEIADNRIENWMNEPKYAEPEIIHCKDCKWWDKEEGSSYGYCHAIKHSHYSRHWEINIYRKYEPDFYCADAEREEDED